jgi:hypothetical protein
MDQFDINRQMDAAATDAADEAMDLLESDKQRTRDRNSRLVRLDLAHFFDPADGWVLLKQGSQYKQLRRILIAEALTMEQVEAEAPAQGFSRVQAGLYWNGATQHVYVATGASYALYGLQPMA